MKLSLQNEKYNFAYILIVANLIAFLWPSQSVEGNLNYINYLLFITRILNPIFIFLFIFSYLAKGGKIHLSEITYIALFYTFILIFSSLMGNEPFKNIFIAFFFFMSSISVMNIYPHYYEKFPINIYITKFLIFWASIPVILLIFPDLHPIFVDDFENSFHGFAGSRIEYGLWTTLGIILCVTYRKFIKNYIINLSILLMTSGLFLAQSRSSFIALFICFIYAINRKFKDFYIKFMIFIMLFSVLLLSLLSWESFGRQNIFEFLNSTRIEIYNKYYESITLENLLFGFGGQRSVIIESGSITQAHNLFIQWLSNWGTLGLLSLTSFLYLFWKRLYSPYSKLFFLAFLFYSSTQPIQGTANFFGPVTLLSFFIIIGMESDSRRHKNLCCKF